MSEKVTMPLESHEAVLPQETLTAESFKELVDAYGLNGKSPAERVENLQSSPNANVALFLTDLNKRLIGESESSIADYVMKVGETETVNPEHRYDLFLHLMDSIRESSDINPARIGDAMGLGIVTLHPFKDGNGRTSRMMALLYRDDFDSEGYENAFSLLTESRDVARDRGGTIMIGYIPYFPEGVKQSDPQVVSDYFDALLTQDEDRLYMGPAGQQAPLHEKTYTSK